MAKSKGGMSQSQLNHHANQSNPNNPSFTAGLNNHANQLNPNNPAYNSGDDGQPTAGDSSFDSMGLKEHKVDKNG